MNKVKLSKVAQTISVEQANKVVRNLTDYIAAAKTNGYILPKHGANLINR